MTTTLITAFMTTGSGHLAVHRFSDGLPCAVVAAREAWKIDRRVAYPVPICERDYELYRTDLPEL